MLGLPVTARTCEMPREAECGDLMGDDLKALLIDRFGLDLGLAEASGLTPLMARILTRRTHRAFTSARVDPALVDLLIAVALSASSKSDFQQVAIVKLKDEAKRKRIAV